MPQVTVVFGGAREYVLEVDAAGLDALGAGAARDWLAREFGELNLAPANPMGKILALDMILALARNAGEAAFARPDAWVMDFARVTARVLDREAVRVDVDGATVG